MVVFCLVLQILRSTSFSCTACDQQTSSFPYKAGELVSRCSVLSPAFPTYSTRLPNLDTSATGIGGWVEKLALFHNVAISADRKKKDYTRGNRTRPISTEKTIRN